MIIILCHCSGHPGYYSSVRRNSISFTKACCCVCGCFQESLPQFQMLCSDRRWKHGLLLHHHWCETGVYPLLLKNLHFTIITLLRAIKKRMQDMTSLEDEAVKVGLQISGNRMKIWLLGTNHCDIHLIINTTNIFC